MEAAGKRYILYSGNATQIRLWAFADLHYGTKACALDMFKQHVKEIKKDPYSFWLTVGDMAEFISPSDSRFDASCITDKTATNLASLGSHLTHDVCNLLKPIKHKGIGLGKGNHEHRYMVEKEQQQLHHWLCTELAASNLEYSSFLQLTFVKTRGYKEPQLMPLSWSRWKAVKTHNLSNAQTFRIVTWHGAGSANTPGGKINRLNHLMASFPYEQIFIMAHAHDQAVQVRSPLTTNTCGQKIIAKPQIGIITGAYLKTYAQGITTYGELKGYAPSTLGAVQLTIEPAKRRVSTSLGGEL